MSVLASSEKDEIFHFNYFGNVSVPLAPNPIRADVCRSERLKLRGFLGFGPTDRKLLDRKSVLGWLKAVRATDNDISDALVWNVCQLRQRRILIRTGNGSDNRAPSMGSYESVIFNQAILGQQNILTLRPFDLVSATYLQIRIFRSHENIVSERQAPDGFVERAPPKRWSLTHEGDIFPR